MKYIMYLLLLLPFGASSFGVAEENNLDKDLSNYIQKNSRQGFGSGFRDICQSDFEDLEQRIKSSGAYPDSTFTLLASGRLRNQDSKTPFIKGLLAYTQELDNRYFLDFSDFDNSAMIFLRVEEFEQATLYLISIPPDNSINPLTLTFCFGKWRQ